MQSDRGGHSATKGPSRAEHAFYRPLDPAAREIRIVRLLPGQGDDPVSVILVHATLSVHDRAGGGGTDMPPPPEASIPYEAISYTWGKRTKKLPMCIDGYEVPAPASAVDVLRTFRQAVTPRSIWIDAVCINQHDLVERASHVAFMGDIYEAASETLVWLGHEDENTSSALNACRRVVQQMPTFSSAVLDNNVGLEREKVVQISTADKAALLAIYDRRWFSRAWVLQEAALSRSCICYLGSLTIEWRHLMLIASWLVSTRAYEVGPAGRFPDAVKTLDEIALMADHGLMTRKPRSISLLLQQTSLLHSSDPRDKIYTLLSLSSWRDAESQRRVGLRPDYRKSFRQCAGDAVRCAIFEDHNSSGDGTASLDVLGYLILGAAEHAEVERKQWPWPSWIRYRSKIRRFDNTRSPMSNNCSAGNSLRQDDALVDVTRSQPGRDMNVLSLRGVVVDHVRDFIAPAAKSSANIALVRRAVRGGLKSFQDMMAFCAGDRDHDVYGPITAEDERLHDIMQGSEILYTDSEDEDHQSRKVRARGLLRRISAIVKGRKFFRTLDGRMGIGPGGLQQGDRIVVLFGGRLPFVIGNRGYGDVLVGPCFLRGIMQGEAVQDTQAARRQSQIFYLY